MSLVFRKGKPEADGLDAAFMRRDLAELDYTARYREPGQEKAKPSAASWIVPIRRRELERLSPGTLAFLEYRSPRDREILLKMYGYDAEGNPVNPRPLLGDQGPGTWNARFYTEFNMTNDRDLWTDPKTGKVYNPRQILGPVPGTTDRPPYYDPRAFPEIRERMAEKGFWPLYEGKHVHSSALGIQPIARWVDVELAARRTQIEGRARRAVIRRIAAPTDERTLITGVLDPECFSNDQLIVVESPLVDPDTVATQLGSFVTDFAVRPRVMRHVDQHILRLIPIAHLATFTPVETKLACDDGTHPFDQMAYWKPIWLANRAVAQAYGLTPDDFEYILSTFPVFARKRPEFYGYLLERVQEWRREVEGAKVYTISAAGLARAAETSEAYATESDRQPAASRPFQQAAVLAWVVHKLHSPGYPVSRCRVQKMLYLMEAATETGLFTEFRKQTAGPYDPGLRYGGPEDIAVRQKRWLTTPDDTHFEPGPNIAEAIGYASRYLDEHRAKWVVKQFRGFRDETLERWTTVHLAAVELQRRGDHVTPETVLAYIQRVPEWQAKLSREEFAPDRIGDALAGLRKLGMLLTQGGDVGS